VAAARLGYFHRNWTPWYVNGWNCFVMVLRGMDKIEEIVLAWRQKWRCGANFTRKLPQERAFLFSFTFLPTTVQNT